MTARTLTALPIWTDWHWRPTNVLCYFLAATFRFLLDIARYLPDVLARWTLFIIRFFFLSLLGAGLWIRHFANNEFIGAVSFVGICICAAYVFYAHSKRTESEMQNRYLEQRRIEIKRIRERLEKDFMLANNESKNVDATDFNPPLHADPNPNSANSSDHELRQLNAVLENQLRKCRDEAVGTSRSFREKLDEMETIVERMKDMEREKSRSESELVAETEMNDQIYKEVSMLQETVEVLGKQRRRLQESNASLKADIRTLKRENQSLHAQLLANRRESKNNYLGDLAEIAHLLQSSLSSAKGKLHRVESFLKETTSDERSRAEYAYGDM